MNYDIMISLKLFQLNKKNHSCLEVDKIYAKITINKIIPRKTNVKLNISCSAVKS